MDLITKNIDPQNIINAHHLQRKINENKVLQGYWGTAPTGRCHIGYLVPLMKIADFVKAGCEITILLADIHAFLDARKSALEDKAKTEYYKIIITEVLKILNVDLSKIRFVCGSEYQYSKEYITDLLRLLNTISFKKAQHAGAEVVKQSDDPLLSSLVYPIMQALDEKYLNADFELGGIDQRKIFAFSIDYVHDANIKKKGFSYIMNKIVPGLRKTKQEVKQEDKQKVNDNNKDQNEQQDKDQEVIQKMSASDTNGKIDLLDTPAQITKKIRQTYCLEGDITDNSLLPLCDNIIFPLLERLNMQFEVKRKEEYGGNVVIESYNSLVELFENKSLHPADLKNTIAYLLATILEPLRNRFANENEQKILFAAYGKQ